MNIQKEVQVLIVEDDSIGTILKQSSATGFIQIV
jgi:hypothetical protein